MSDDLKPCPFCGVGVRAMSRYHPRDPNEWYVSCGAKDCVMQPETPTYRTEAEAVAAWNRRASDTEIERLRAALRVARFYLSAQGSRDVDTALAALSPIDAPPSIYDGLVDPKRTRRVT